MSATESATRKAQNPAKERFEFSKRKTKRKKGREIGMWGSREGPGEAEGTQPETSWNSWSWSAVSAKFQTVRWERKLAKKHPSVAHRRPPRRIRLHRADIAHAHRPDLDPVLIEGHNHCPPRGGGGNWSGVPGHAGHVVRVPSRVISGIRTSFGVLRAHTWASGRVSASVEVRLHRVC